MISNNFITIHGSFAFLFLTTWLMLFLIVFHGFSQPKPKPKQAAAKAPVQSNFVMCYVMPGAEVAAKVQFTIPFKNAVAWPAADIKTGCRYIFKSEDDESVTNPDY